MATKRAAVLLLALSAAGCAELKVNVSVYRGPIPVLSSEALQLVEAVETDPQIDPHQRERWRSNYVRAIGDAVVQQNADAYRGGLSPEGARRQAEMDWSQIRPAVEKDVADYWAEITPRLATLRQNARALRERIIADGGTTLKPRSVTLYRDLAMQHSDYRRSTLEYQSMLEGKLLGVGSGGVLSPALAEAVGRISDTAPAAAGIATGEAVDGRLVGYPIFDAYVTHLGQRRKDWVSFGRNRFSAVGGNTQFVVVREGHVVFHQKSLDFDPTPVIGAGAALTKVGLKVAAAAASGMTGFPVAGLVGGSGTAPSEPAQQEQFDETDIDARKAILAGRRRAKGEFLNALADLLDRLDAGASPDEIKSELSATVQTYEARVTPISGGSQP